MLLIGVLYLYGRSVTTTLTKSVREMGIYLLVVIAVIAIVVLTLNLNP